MSLKCLDLSWPKDWEKLPFSVLVGMGILFPWKGGYTARFSCRTCFASFSLLFAGLAVGFGGFVMVSNRKIAKTCAIEAFLKGIVWVGPFPPPFPVYPVYLWKKWQTQYEKKRSQHPDCDFMASWEGVTDPFISLMVQKSCTKTLFYMKNVWKNGEIYSRTQLVG